MNEITVVIDYKAHGRDLREELQSTLPDHYTSVIRPRGGTAAGGIYDAGVEIIFNLELKDFVMIAVEGLAWDLIKMGTRNFMLRPLVKAFEVLEGESNQAIDFGSMILRFQDTDLYLYGMEDMFTVVIPKVIPHLIKNYDSICGADGPPESIVVPLRYEEGAGRFIDGGFGDSHDIEEYTKYWGISYDIFDTERRIYDVEQSSYLDAAIEKEY